MPADGVGVLGEDLYFFEELSGDCFGLSLLVEDGDAEEVLDLSGEDHDGDAGGETGDDGVGDELDECPESEEAHEDDDASGHACCEHEPLVAVGRGDGEDNGNECGGGPADLYAAAAAE